MAHRRFNGRSAASVGVAALLACAINAARAGDWANLARYHGADAARSARARPRAVFIGDSLTENWAAGDPSFFADGLVGRGISGQTTSQVLLRFYQDAVSLRPRVVHIMAGTNDVAENDGPISDGAILDNVRAMLDIARANHIGVVLASIPPMAAVPWRPGVQGTASRIVDLNGRLRALAAARRVTFVDYRAALADARNGLRSNLGDDGVHLNALAYRIIRPLTVRALRRAER